MDQKPRAAKVDKKEILELRGRLALESLLDAAGGLLPATQVAHLLGLSRDQLDEEAKARRILSIKFEGHAGYPAFQFSSEGELLPHLPEIMALLVTDSDIAKLRFFLTPDPDLNGTAAQALREGRDLALVMRKATQFGVQTAK